MWGCLPHRAAKDCNRFTFGHGETAVETLPCLIPIDTLETLPDNELIGGAKMLLGSE